MSISSSSVRARTAGGIWSAVSPAAQSTMRSLTDLVSLAAAFIAPPGNAVSFECRLLVATDGHELGNSAAGRAKLDRDHARIADDLAAVLADLRFGCLQILDLDREVMDTRPFARRLRFRRLGAGVVLDQREVDRAVAQVARQVIARLARLDFAEAEYLLVELGGFFEILHFQCQMHDAVHAASFR